MADVTGTYYANEGGIGYGTELGVGQGDGVAGPPIVPETFVSIPVLLKITPGDLITGIVDGTHLRSPKQHREKKGTLRDSGAIVCDGFYIPGHGAHNVLGGDGFDEFHNLIVLWQTVAKNNYRIIMPDHFDNLTIDLKGVITRYQVGEMSTEVIVPFTLEITPTEDYWTGPTAGTTVAGTAARMRAAAERTDRPRQHA